MTNASLTPPALAAFTSAQLNHLFPDGDLAFVPAEASEEALRRLTPCFAATNTRYTQFWRDGEVFFNHLHSDHYVMYLYLVANTLFVSEGASSTCNKLFLLNKALHGLDLLYSVELPQVFLLVHPLGTVLGRATYGNQLLVYQGVTVGSRFDEGDYPKIGHGVSLYAGATVLGDVTLGDGATIAARALLLEGSVPAHHLYAGQPGSARKIPSDRRDPVWR